MKFDTKCIHAGLSPDPFSGAVMTPIYQTSTYAQEEPGKHKGFEYARSQNPTRSALERNLARLEKGTHAYTFSSGLAAMDSIMRLLNPGDEVIATNDIYGGSYRQMVKVHARYGITSHFTDLGDLAGIEQLINKNTKAIWIETPTNPMLKLVDIEAVAQLAKSKGILVCVDNTFASPYLQNPLDMGADIVLHSATKYLGGHSDVVMGAVIVKDANLAEKIAFLQNAVGAIPGPQDCFLMLRGIKTLHIRVERACKNAKKIAKFLVKHPKVGAVHYPGLKTHPQYKLAKRQMRKPGAMISFDFGDDDYEKALKVLRNTHYFTLAESLGGVESLIGHPASMTHAGIPKEERMKIGLNDGLIRLSIGIENVDDLIADLKEALK